MNTQNYQLVIYWSSEDKAYIVEVPELPGCIADGKTRQEALANAEIIIQEWLEVAREEGRKILTPQEKLINSAEAAKRLGLSVALIRRYCTTGRLAAQKVGRDWAIRLRDLEDFSTAQRRSGRPARSMQHADA